MKSKYSMEKENLNFISKLSDKEAEVAYMYWELGRAKFGD